MSSHVLLNIQSQPKGKWLYIQYNMDVNVVNNIWNKNMERFVFFKSGEDSYNFEKIAV